jgi:hypothetical protein
MLPPPAPASRVDHNYVDDLLIEFDLVFDDGDPLGLLSRAALRLPSFTPPVEPGCIQDRISLTMMPPPWATGLRDSARISTRCGGAFWPNRRELSRHLKYMARRTDS